MKLAIVSPFPPEISGVGQYGARLAEGLAHTRRFSAVQVFGNLTPNVSPNETGNGFTIRRVWERDSAMALLRILRAVREWQPDAVWFNLGLSVFGRTRFHNFKGLLAPMLTARSGLPTIVTLHEIFEAVNLRALGAMNGRITHWGGALAMRSLLQADTLCLTLSSYVRVMRQNYGARNVVHMPHGAFDTPHFTELPPTNRILIFGTFAPYKGLTELISIYRTLRQTDPTLTLTVAGNDHPRFPGYLAQTCAQTGAIPGIEWRMNVPEAELPALFQSASVVALPYTATTGASSVAHRAATHGRPVVTYALPDLQEVADEEGLRVEFVPVGDRTAFAERLQSLLNDRARCAAIGRANVAAIQPHTLEAMCKRYIDVFEGAIAKRAVKRPITPSVQFHSTEGD
jgi:glycosyltransferase involved in cell wall biosynthesis